MIALLAMTVFFAIAFVFGLLAGTKNKSKKCLKFSFCDCLRHPDCTSGCCNEHCRLHCGCQVKAKEEWAEFVE